MITFGSLFAGIGGLDLGLERAGMQCKWQVEIDEYATRVLAKHWPNVRRWDDVRTWPQPDTERVDLICGGDPCQANSKAGRSTQASLADQFIRIVNELRPRIVLRENPTAIRRDAPWPWFRFRSALESIGYAVVPFRLRACCFGAFHQRDRLFLLAELADSHCDRLEGWQANGTSGISSKSSGFMDANDWLALYARRGIGSRAGIPGYVDRIRGLGNAVVPQVAEWIGRRIIDALDQQSSSKDCQ